MRVTDRQGKGVLDPLAEQVKLTPMIGILQPALFGTALWVLLLTGCSPSSDDISVLGGAEDRFAPGRGIEDRTTGCNLSSPLMA